MSCESEITNDEFFDIIEDDFCWTLTMPDNIEELSSNFISKDKIENDPRFANNLPYYGCRNFNVIKTAKIEEICDQWVKHAAFKKGQKRSTKITPEVLMLFNKPTYNYRYRYVIDDVLKKMGYSLQGSKTLKHIKNSSKSNIRKRADHLLLQDYKSCMVIWESIYWSKYRYASHTFGKYFSQYPELWKKHTRFFKKITTKKEFLKELKSTIHKTNQPYVLCAYNQKEIKYGIESKPIFDLFNED